MGIHTIEVTGISDELLERLDERVRQQGGDRAEFVRELLLRELRDEPRASDGTPPPHPGISFAEILAPVHEQVAESGMTDEEVDRLFEEARQRVRGEKRAARSR